MEMKKPGLVSAKDWRAEIKIEAREKVFKAILGKLNECSSPYDMYMDKIANHARGQEMKLLKTAKSKEQYYSGLARMLNGSENPPSNQDRPALIPKKDQEAFDGQPLPHMNNHPHPKNQQPAVPFSLLKPYIPPSTSQPHEQKLKLRQTNQNFGVHNQRCVSPHNALNSPCQPQGVQSRVESVTQHPKVLKLQPNENLSAKVKEEVIRIRKDFHASTYLHNQLSAIEQHKQNQSLQVPAVPNGNSNAEEWHGQALSEVRHLRNYLPVLKMIYEKTSERLLQIRQIELMQKYEHQKNVLQVMIKFLELPEDRIFIIFRTKDGFYRRVQVIWKHVEIFFENWSMSLANKQQPLRGQSSLSQFHINSVQQRDNMNPHFQLVNLATTGSYDSSSPRAPREIGSLTSEAGCIQKCMLQKKQTENIKQEFHSSWIQQNQKSTENIKASNRSGMRLEYHLKSKISPETLEASKLSKIAEQALSINPSATLYERASPIPPSSTVGLGKNPTNPSNSQCSQGSNSLKVHASKLSKISEQARPINPSATLYERASSIPPSLTVGLGKDPTNPSNSQCSQGCNSLKLHDSKTEVQVQSHENRSSSIMTCQLAEPTNLENKVQLPTETRPHNRLLKAVESISNKASRVAVSEINSVMEDRITEPWCCKKESYLSFQDGCGFSSNLKRKINATTLNDMPSPCSIIDESGLLVTSSYKKLKKMSDHALLEEMRKINSQFIETVLEFDTDEKFNRQWAHAGTVFRLSYRAATESKNTVLHSANTLKFPVLSIKLLLPLDYPEHYPVLLSKFDTAYGTGDDALKRMSREAGLLLRRFLDANHDYLSLEDYANAWNVCARSVVLDYAKCAGGGNFSSRYGNWEDCVAAA